MTPYLLCILQGPIQGFAFDTNMTPYLWCTWSAMHGLLLTPTGLHTSNVLKWAIQGLDSDTDRTLYLWCTFKERFRGLLLTLTGRHTSGILQWAIQRCTFDTDRTPYLWWSCARGFTRATGPTAAPSWWCVRPAPAVPPSSSPSTSCWLSTPLRTRYDADAIICDVFKECRRWCSWTLPRFMWSFN